MKLEGCRKLRWVYLIAVLLDCTRYCWKLALVHTTFWANWHLYVQCSEQTGTCTYNVLSKLALVRATFWANWHLYIQRSEQTGTCTCNVLNKLALAHATFWTNWHLHMQRSEQTGTCTCNVLNKLALVRAMFWTNWHLYMQRSEQTGTCTCNVLNKPQFYYRKQKFLTQPTPSFPLKCYSGQVLYLFVYIFSYIHNSAPCYSDSNVWRSRAWRDVAATNSSTEHTGSRQTFKQTAVVWHATARAGRWAATLRRNLLPISSGLTPWQQNHLKAGTHRTRSISCHIHRFSHPLPPGPPLAQL